jgi:hypothetical protein
MRASSLVLVVTCAVAGCPGTLDDGFADDGFDGFGGFGGFGEVSVRRSLSFSLVPPNLEQRFRLPVTVSPPSPDARIEALFSRVDGVVVGDLNADIFANPSPSSWALLEPGLLLTTFSSGFSDEEIFRLSLATNGPPAAVAVEIIVTAPSDVDFDGLDDDVRVEVGVPQPFIP